jgi:hypothetical protein
MSSISRRIKANADARKRLEPKLKLAEQMAFENGFDAGAAKQREMDIRFLAKVLVELEELPGVGSKTADKLRGLILSKFGYEPLVKQ